MLWLPEWIKKQLSDILEDNENVQMDWRQGNLILRNVSLAAAALRQVSGELSVAAPFIAKRISVREVKVSIEWTSFTVKIGVEDVKLHLATQPAKEWDVTAASENYQAAKKEALMIHEEIIRLGHSEGSGYLHSLAAASLDNFEFCVNELTCIVSDRASWMRNEHEAPRCFHLGAGVRKVELAAGSNITAGSNAALRRLLIEQPFVYLDHDAESVRKDHRAIREAHSWIIRPSEEVCFEVGLLQCRRPLTAASLASKDSKGPGFLLVRPLDFAELAQPMHADRTTIPAAKHAERTT
jgi:hypothetical protein